MVIVRNIWQKPSSIEHEMMLIVKNYWQLLSYIFGETSLIVKNIWRTLTYRIRICNLYKAHKCLSGHQQHCRYYSSVYVESEYLLSEAPTGVTWFYRRMLDKTDEVMVRL